MTATDFAIAIYVAGVVLMLCGPRRAPEYWGMDFGRAVVVAAWPVLVVSGLIGVARGMVRRGTLGNG